MVTSTDNDYIRNIASKYKIKLYVRDGESDIQDDWNFGYSKAKSDLVTIAHQDDVYDSKYLEYILKYFKIYNDTLYVSTNNNVLKNG